jgi:1-acyl-sn-glycerol-3-phosphate acyltransferase
MYEALGVPVVPVGLNSGLFWERRGLVLWPGLAEAKIGPPIPPGFSPETFRARLVEAVEGATNELILKAYDKGLARPISPEFRQRLEDLKAGRPPGPVPQTTTS